MQTLVILHSSESRIVAKVWNMNFLKLSVIERSMRKFGNASIIAEKIIFHEIKLIVKT